MTGSGSGMPSLSNLTFAGYDEEKAVVLLKGPLGAVYPLQPAHKGARTAEVDADGANDDEGSYEESTCSDSYVSSASSSSSGSSVSDVNTPHTNGAGVAGGGEESDAQHLAPVHGTVLSLQEPYRRKSDPLPFYPLMASGSADEAKSYHAVVVLGYDERGNVFLLPTPRIVWGDTVCAYQCSPILQLSMHDLHQYYQLQEHAENEAREDTSSWELPLEGGCMMCPRLEQAPLSDIFGVSVGKAYYLSAWSVYVEFVGAAWGVPWVRLLPTGVAGNGFHSASKRGGQTVRIKPLPYCYGERPLCEVYMLCEDKDDAEGRNVHNTPMSQCVDVTTGAESWSHIREQAQQEGGSAANIESTRGSFTHHRSFTPRGTRYAAHFNTTDSSVSAPLPFFVRGSKVACCGPFGSTLECDVSPKTLERFGVLHGDRLVGAASRSFEGRKTTVIGVHMGCLVVLLDGDRVATILRGVEGMDDLLVQFSKETDPQCDRDVGRGSSTSEENQVIPSPSMDVQEEDNGVRKEAHSDDNEGDEKERDPVVGLPPIVEASTVTAERDISESKHTTSINTDPLDRGNELHGTIEAKVPLKEDADECGAASQCDAGDSNEQPVFMGDDPSPLAFVQRFDTSSIDLTDSSIREVWATEDEKAPSQAMGSGDGGVEEERDEEEMDEEERDEEERDEEKMDEEGMGEEERDEEEMDEEERNEEEMDEEERDEEERDEEKMDEEGMGEEERDEEERDEEEMDEEERNEEKMDEEEMGEEGMGEEERDEEERDEEERDEEERDEEERNEEELDEEKMGEEEMDEEEMDEEEMDEEEMDEEERDEEEMDEEEINEEDGGNGSAQPTSEARLTEVGGLCSDGQLEGGEAEAVATEVTNSLFFTTFLKALAYWKMQLLTDEEQRQQPLAFIEYYGTDTQRRMLGAVDLLHKYRSFFDAPAQGSSHLLTWNYDGVAPPTVQQIVHLLVEMEAVQGP